LKNIQKFLEVYKKFNEEYVWKFLKVSRKILTKYVELFSIFLEKPLKNRFGSFLKFSKDHPIICFQLCQSFQKDL
jgi:hypothetical protein